MRLDFEQLALAGLLTSTLHWLMARAEITRPLWSRLRGFFGRLLACPACSGFWLGTALGAVGVRPLATASLYVDVAGCAVLSVFLTPVFQAVLLWGLEHAAVNEDAPPPPG